MLGRHVWLEVPRVEKCRKASVLFICWKGGVSRRSTRKDFQVRRRQGTYQVGRTGKTATPTGREGEESRQKDRRNELEYVQ